jgi:two-component system, OmpR family, KDP operon response regulator KdpE
VDEGHIFVVDDDPALLRLVEMALQLRGYRVSSATTGMHALDQIVNVEPDVVILDLGLPDMDGLEVGRHLRARSRASVLVLTADGAEDRKVLALDGAADDYLTKPFSMRELVARVGVAVRHQRRFAATVVDDRPIEVGGLRIDPGGHRAAVDGTPLELTAKEFALLMLLARNQGRVVTHKAILTALWGPGQGVDTLRTHVNQLRRKLEAIGGAPKLVTEVRVGYRLVPA